MPRRNVLISTNRSAPAGLLAEGLRDLGIDAAVVAPGAPTLSTVLSRRPDLVLVDADHVHGCRTVMRLADISAPPDIVALADARDSSQVDACLLAGASDIVAWDQVGSLPVAVRDRLDGVPLEGAGTIVDRRRRALARLAGDRSTPAA